MAKSSTKQSESTEPANAPTEEEVKKEHNPNAPENAKEEREIADANDIALAVRHHKKGLTKAWSWVEVIFHYFFVGSLSIATLLIAFAIPLAMLAALMSLLLVPAYVIYTLARVDSDPPTTFFNQNKFLLASLVVITIYWAGYFFQHGWPRMQGALQRMYVKAAPLITWALKSLNRFGDDKKEDEEPAE